MKIHHFKKRVPPAHPGWGRDTGRVTLELEHPTLPEMALHESEEVEDEQEEPVRSKSRREPEPQAKGRGGSAAPEADGRGSRKGRGASRKAASEEAPAPGSVAERLNTARELVSKGRLDDARVILERLVKLGVASGPVHTELGAIYMAQGSLERALERFDEALQREPMDLFARVCRGEARLEHGDLRLAREDLQRVLDMGTAGSPLVERAQQLLQWANEQGDRKRQ